MTVFAGLIHVPDGSGAKLAAVVVCHCSPLDVGAAATQPIKAFGSPAIDAVGPLTHCPLNAMLDAAYPRGALNYWTSNFLAQLSDAAIETMIEAFVANGAGAPRALPWGCHPGRDRPDRLSPSRRGLRLPRGV